MISTFTSTKLAEFDEKFKCIQSDCDGKGNIPHQVSEDEWEAQQCQFHAEYIFPIKSDYSRAITEAYLLGANHPLDYIEAECEWVKEDVPDGNDGYFIVRASDLAAIRKEIDGTV